MIEINTEPKPSGTMVHIRTESDNGIILCEECLAVMQAMYERMYEADEELGMIFVKETGNLITEWIGEIIGKESIKEW